MDDGAERATHLVKRPWTPEEDEALVAAVTKYGACRWSMIATHLESGASASSAASGGTTTCAPR